ncbi:unnamed protein product [Protopolystoma xenopodis]|uniref:Uncharacterized protein n=1 Tax=Protopolystoma xenopodis TaxID=117903 RepID=A0A3S5BT21_9PLAT|nr:unnamed protein product [Protopolystoma xenopodis]
MYHVHGPILEMTMHTMNSGLDAVFICNMACVKQLVDLPALAAALESEHLGGLAVYDAEADNTPCTLFRQVSIYLRAFECTHQHTETHMHNFYLHNILFHPYSWKKYSSRWSHFKKSKRAPDAFEIEKAG